jgi:hypothetical protein
MMTPDEMDKKIEFILGMQAQFEANLARSEANTDKLRISVADLAGVVRDSIKLSDDRFTRLDHTMRELAEAQKTTDERLRELAEAQKTTDGRLRELADAQKTTDERLNALINVTEKHITGPDHAPRA